jgi:hypothetical protein
MLHQTTSNRKNKKNKFLKLILNFRSKILETNDDDDHGDPKTSVDSELALD